MRIQLAILRSAACLMPRDQRAEWFAEWSAELCYVVQKGDRRATGFCLGAFRDALWLRRNSPANARGVLRLESPIQCLGFLALLAAATVFFAFRLPGPRDMILPLPYRDAQNLAMISRPGPPTSMLPTVSLDEYASLANPMQPRFNGMAFYRPIRARLQTADLSVALASGSLFDLLGIPIPHDQPEPALILSDTAARKCFGREPHIAGRIVDIAGRRARIAAVIPADLWRLPGRIDVWLIDDRGLALLPRESKGFVLARLIHPQRESRSRLSIPSDGRYVSYDCATLVNSRPLIALLMMTVIALLVLPATTSLGLGEYPATRDWRRWMFFAVKIALILPAVFFGALDLGPMFAGPLMLAGYVAALRWALLDQRQRCPDCLRLLARPTRIGRPSQTFLEWYGTEFVCLKGHGLLHVPEIPTISFATQQWMHLDLSWCGLFTTPASQSQPPVRT